MRTPRSLDVVQAFRLRLASAPAADQNQRPTEQRAGHGAGKHNPSHQRHRDRDDRRDRDHPEAPDPRDRNCADVDARVTRWFAHVTHADASVWKTPARAYPTLPSSFNYSVSLKG